MLNNQTTKNLSLYLHLNVMAYENETTFYIDKYQFCCCFDDFNEYLFLFLLDSIFSIFGPLWICMVSLGGSMVLLVPAVLIRIKSKKRKGPENYDIIPLQEIYQNQNDLAGIDSVLNEEERVYSNITSHRIPIDAFIQQVERKKNCNQFSDEFQVK